VIPVISGFESRRSPMPDVSDGRSAPCKGAAIVHPPFDPGIWLASSCRRTRRYVSEAWMPRSDSGREYSCRVSRRCGMWSAKPQVEGSTPRRGSNGPKPTG
jgi:hypothetical protein